MVIMVDLTSSTASVLCCTSSLHPTFGNWMHGVESRPGCTRQPVFIMGVGLSVSGPRPHQMRQYSNVPLCEGLKMDGQDHSQDETPPLGGLAWWRPSIRAAPEVCAAAV